MKSEVPFRTGSFRVHTSLSLNSDELKMDFRARKVSGAPSVPGLETGPHDPESSALTI